MFLMSSSDFKHRGISQEEFPRVFGFAECPGLGLLILSSAPVRSTELSIRGLLTSLTAPVQSLKFPKSAKLFSLR